MFDQDTRELFVVSDGSIGDRVNAADHDAAEISDLEDAVMASTGAQAVSVLRLQPNARGQREFQPPRGSPSVFSRLDQSLRSLQDSIERLLRKEMPDSKAFWLRGIDATLCIPIAIGGALTACLVLSYPAHILPPESAEAERQANLIAPLVRAHLQANDRLSDVSRKLDGALGFLDVSHVALIQFDNQGAMILANQAARTLLAGQNGMRMGARAPSPTSLRDAARFQLALEHQIAQNAMGRAVKRRSTVFLIERGKGMRPLVATLIPMPAAAAGPGDPAVMLCLFDPSDERFDHLDAISELYGLSRVEARLARHISLGKTIEEAAGVMRIKAPTARTYLKHIFAKTGTHRQIDLVRLLMLSTARLVSSDQPEALR